MTVLTIWSYVRRYAWFGFAVLSAVLAYLLFRRPDLDGSLTTQLEDIRRLHEEELRKIREADEELRKRHLDNERQLQRALELLDADHRRRLEELSLEKRGMIDKIVRDHGDDPRELAELLAKTLDLTIS